MSTASEFGSAVEVRSGLSWRAALGGATVATAVTIMLVSLGSGIGLASVSPANGATNPSAATFTVYAAVWLIVTQWVSSFFGGYLAGRLRPGWTGLGKEEVIFRDTATGFVAWAVASILVVTVASSGASALLSGATRAVTSVAASAGGAAAQSSATGTPSGYLLDALFRPAQSGAQESPADAKAEAGRILATGATGTISQEDHAYLVQLVAARTGLSPADAAKRTDDVVAKEQQAVSKAQQVANAARKAIASFSVYTFFSMLVGAFIACVAAAIGGKQRDA